MLFEPGAFNIIPARVTVSLEYRPHERRNSSRILRAANISGLAALPLASGAGHDTQSLVEICPAGMIFVPSVGGISHAPEEYTIWQDCLNGANLLLQAVLELAAKSKRNCSSNSATG